MYILVYEVISAKSLHLQGKFVTLLLEKGSDENLLWIIYMYAKLDS